MNADSEGAGVRIAAGAFEDGRVDIVDVANDEFFGRPGGG